MKYFFFDIDGTLKPYGRKIPMSTKHTILKLQSQGNKVFLATGRRRREIVDIMEELHLKDAVCAGGACVIINNKVEREIYFDKRELSKILNECRKYNIIVVSVGNGESYTTYKGIKLLPYILGMKLYSKLKNFKVGSVNSKSSVDTYINIKTVSEEEYLNMSVQKLMFYNSRSISKVKSLQKYTIYNERICKSIEFDFKEQGIEFVRKKYNLSLDDIVVFGDGPNDISMFKYAVNSIAMGNSCDEIKKLASFVTKDSWDNGIEYACKHFGWI